MLVLSPSSFSLLSSLSLPPLFPLTAQGLRDDDGDGPHGHAARIRSARAGRPAPALHSRSQPGHNPGRQPHLQSPGQEKRSTRNRSSSGTNKTEAPRNAAPGVSLNFCTGDKEGEERGMERTKIKLEIRQPIASIFKKFIAIIFIFSSLCLFNKKKQLIYSGRRRCASRARWIREHGPAARGSKPRPTDTGIQSRPATKPGARRQVKQREKSKNKREEK